MQNFIDRIMLPVLQEKLQRGVVKAEEWPDALSEISSIVTAVLMQEEKSETSAVDTSLSHESDSDQNMNESSTDGNTGILDILMSQLLINAVMIAETVYTDMSEIMMQLLLQLQLSDVKVSM